MISILIIEDEAILGQNIAKFLSRSGFNVNLCDNGIDGLALIAKQSFDILLLDYNLPDMNGLDILAKCLKNDPSMKVIMMTGEGNIEIAVTAMKSGAFDYLAKPLVLKELKILLEKAVSQQKRDSTMHYYQDKVAEHGRMDDICGESEQMIHVKQRLAQIIQADTQASGSELAAVLVRGETGTGKELIAKALHFDGPRREQPFVEINCAAIPGDLLESELFGHEKGAFTGATVARKGLFESANGGTLFIDEIGDMPVHLQSKLLKVIEEKKFRRLGDNREKKIDVRIVSATHQNLEEKIADKSFRQDLFFRLSVLNIDLPPLRNRGNDILLLADLFLQEFSKKYNKAHLTLCNNAIALLKQYAWPGNIRELKNCMEQAVMLCQDEQLTDENLWLPKTEQAITPSSINLNEEGFNLITLETNLIQQALTKTDGNVTKAAKLLGLSRDTLRYRMEKHHIAG
ncbi:MAG TPA: sigma-54-dependent Fis family transcriptional regulator [Aeromonadales bacterium]|nr:sigma-54-dependent Fis family transcriptional regulator [Aeromonadales bacterium]